MACRRMATSVVGLVSRAGRSPLGAGGLSSSAVGRLPAVYSSSQPSLLCVRGFSAMDNSKLPLDKLSDENKEVVRVVSLMMTEQVEQMKEYLESSHMVLLKKFHDQQRHIKKVQDQQDDIKMMLYFSLFVGGAAIAWAVNSSNKLKAQSIEMTNNLVSHSDEIVYDLVQAVIHGVNMPNLLGPGEPFSWQGKWLKVKKPPGMGWLEKKYAEGAAGIVKNYAVGGAGIVYCEPVMEDPDPESGMEDPDPGMEEAGTLKEEAGPVKEEPGTVKTPGQEEPGRVKNPGQEEPGPVKNPGQEE